jgi:hypothetical protein
MNRYRIKVETNHQGERSYIPQVGEVYIKGKIFQNLFTEWGNIICGSVYPYKSVYLEQPYQTEEEALEVIESYKNYLETEGLEEVKDIKYINL